MLHRLDDSQALVARLRAELNNSAGAAVCRGVDAGAGGKPLGAAAASARISTLSKKNRELLAGCNAEKARVAKLTKTVAALEHAAAAKDKEIDMHKVGGARFRASVVLSMAVLIHYRPGAARCFG